MTFSNNKTSRLFFLLFMVIFLNLITVFQINSVLLAKRAFVFESYSNSGNYYNPSSAGYWIITNKIHINNNWSDTVLDYDWCSGSGTWNNPYTIQNMTFNNLNLGNCIEIENSTDYFVIRNCTIIDTGLLWSDAAIKLNNTFNGSITNNTITSNMGHGARLIQSSNNSI